MCYNIAYYNARLLYYTYTTNMCVIVGVQTQIKFICIIEQQNKCCVKTAVAVHFGWNVCLA